MRKKIAGLRPADSRDVRVSSRSVLLMRQPHSQSRGLCHFHKPSTHYLSDGPRQSRYRIENVQVKNPACGAGWCNVVVLTVHTRQQLIARRGCRTGVRFVSFFLHGGDRMRLCGAWCLSGRWRDRLLADSRWHTRLDFGRCRQITIPGSRALA